MGLRAELDPRKLNEAGWGVIFAVEDQERAPAIKEALKKLLDLRREQAGDHYREYTGQQAFLPGESKSQFLARHGAGPGPADPEKVPYYLLIVGSLEQIPYPFQQQLDIQYAVGRLHFDTLDEYAAYADSVVRAETGRGLLRRTVVFGAINPDDPHTETISRWLTRPLVETLTRGYGGNLVEAVIGPEASKARLLDLLARDQGLGLLVTASHGLAFPAGHPDQRWRQGALLCADWPGPRQWRQPIPADFYFSGDDVAPSMQVHGLIALHYSSFSAGTPQLDEVSLRKYSRVAPTIAQQPFIAQLPMKLLSHPRGGALAVIGLVERAWSYSFDWPSAGVQRAVFESALHRLLDGDTVGSAVEYFNERYAELSTSLSEELEEIQFGKELNPHNLADVWTANNDARNFMIIGDPAVRLPVSQNTR